MEKAKQDPRKPDPDRMHGAGQVGEARRAPEKAPEEEKQGRRELGRDG